MLLEVLRLSGCPSKLIKLFRLLHDWMESHVKDGNLKSEPFKVSREVKQGCVLAPLLFKSTSVTSSDYYRGVWDETAKFR